MPKFETLHQVIEAHPHDFKYEASAAERLFQRIEELEARLSQIGQEGLIQEWQGLTATGDIDGLDDHQLARAAELEDLISRARRLQQFLRDTEFTLHALEFLVGEASRDRILEQLEGLSWRDKHEIIGRGGWCRAQKKAMGLGKTFNRLYLCEVGPREGRENLDREFYSLLRFLPHLCEATGADYLFFEFHGDSQKSPDFTLKDSAESALGLEVTEAPLTAWSSLEEKRWERVSKDISAEFGGEQGTLTIWSRPRAAEMPAQMDRVKRWLWSVVKGEVSSQSPSRSRKFRESSLGIAVSFVKKQIPFVLLDASGDDMVEGFAGSGVEDLIVSSVARTIDKKFSGPKPQVRPCLLAIYDNTRLPMPDYEEIASGLSAKLATASNFFDGVWIFRKKYARRIL